MKTRVGGSATLACQALLQVDRQAGLAETHAAADHVVRDAPVRSVGQLAVDKGVQRTTVTEMGKHRHAVRNPGPAALIPGNGRRD